MENRKAFEVDEDARIKRLCALDKGALSPDGRPLFNRLIFSGSPYLLQHAENPVDWHPWGDEAFNKARTLDRPIFLSIGYATCHWCHVMAHESFEDREVAEVMNRLFVPVKVDREERPEIDEQYMTAAQLMNQSGGWPLNIIMTPEGKPFFAATYLPRSARQGMPGIVDILEQIANVWLNRRKEVEKHAAAVIKTLHDLSKPKSGFLDNTDLLEPAYRQLRSIYDPVCGGFGIKPKFPMPLNILLLLHYKARTGDLEALSMATYTLHMMRRGGIYDQLGFGFHRYSVDAKWLIPHFEKMLYDQALMAICYLQAFQITEEIFFREVAEEIFSYVETEMASPAGGFYSALDADSEGKEGIYYLWTRAEIASSIAPEDSELFFRLFGMGPESLLEGRNILWLPRSLPEFAEAEGLDAEELELRVRSWRRLLLSARSKRIRPLRDEKVLTAWNGLMIAALARGYGVTGSEKYRMLADRAIALIKEKMTARTGRLQRVTYQDNAAFPGLLEDYAFFVWGLIEMHQNTLSPRYLEDATRYTLGMLKLFQDPEGEGFYETGLDGETLLVRLRGGLDGVIPSGNSVAIMNLLRLGHIMRDRKLIETGEAALRFSVGNLETQPLGYMALLMAYDFSKGAQVEITVAGDLQSPQNELILDAVRHRFIPGLVLRQAKADREFPEITGKPAIYICAGGACRPAITDLKGLNKLLDEIAPQGK